VNYTSSQLAGDTNILVIGWNNATSNITSVTDSAGNVYQLAVPIRWVASDHYRNRVIPHASQSVITGDIEDLESAIMPP
jgi:hypothetical protein